MRRKFYCLVSYFVIVFILAAVPVSAAEQPEILPKVEAAMREAYCAMNDLDPQEYTITVEYFGCYERCHIGYLNGDDMGVWPQDPVYWDVAGIVFTFRTSQPLMAYRDGQMLELIQAYDAGWLSDASVLALWNAYSSGIYEDNPGGGNSSWPTEQILPADVETAMIDAFCDLYDVDPQECDKRVRYYGCYDGCYIGFVDCSLFLYPQSQVPWAVAGFVFTFRDGQPMMAYRDGVMLEVTEAYEKGWLSDDSVIALWNVYRYGFREDAPDTGDGIWLPATLLSISGICLVALVSKKKKFA